MKNFTVIIAGGRYFEDYDLLKRKCDRILSRVSARIIIRTGKAKGADAMGERYAQEHGYAIQEFPADWKAYGKSAGYRRNVEMAQGVGQFPNKANALIAFWDGKSRGTQHMIEIAKKEGLAVRVIRYDKYSVEPPAPADIPEPPMDYEEAYKGA